MTSYRPMQERRVCRPENRVASGDGKGNMNPKKKLTKAEGAVMFNSLIRYLRTELG